IHARNLFEFFTRKTGGSDKQNYAFAAAFVSGFNAFQTAEAKKAKDDLFDKICAQISHLTFDRVTGNSPDKFDIIRDAPVTKWLLEPQIRAFVAGLSPEHKRLWDAGAAICPLSQWGF